MLPPMGPRSPQLPHNHHDNYHHRHHQGQQQQQQPQQQLHPRPPQIQYPPQAALMTMPSEQGYHQMRCAEAGAANCDLGRFVGDFGENRSTMSGGYLNRNMGVDMGVQSAAFAQQQHSRGKAMCSNRDMSGNSRYGPQVIPPHSVQSPPSAALRIGNGRISGGVSELPQPMQVVSPQSVHSPTSSAAFQSMSRGDRVPTYPLPPHATPPRPMQSPPVLKSLHVPPSASMRSTTVFYAAVHLRRPFGVRHTTSWGLSLALCAGNVIVRHLLEDLIRPATVWCHVTGHIDSSVVFRPGVDYARRVSGYLMPRSLAPHPSHSVLSHHLLPGDVLLSVDGFAIDTFSNFGDLVRYFKSLDAVTIVVMRSDATMKRAMLREGEASTPAPSAMTPSLAASDLVPHARITTPSVACIRQVTPLQAATPVGSRSNPIDISSDPPTKQLVVVAPPRAPTYTPWPPSSYDIPSNLRNPMFAVQVKDDDDHNDGVFRSKDQFRRDCLPYADNNELDPEDGMRARFFLSLAPTKDFSGWIASRKRKWRERYKVYEIARSENDDDEEEDFGADRDDDQRKLSSVPYDFWRTSHQLESFDEWLSSSKRRWKRGYSWNSRKRRRLEREMRERVRLPSAGCHIAPKQFSRWLHVRQNQWRVLRRKRQRERERNGDVERGAEADVAMGMAVDAVAAVIPTAAAVTISTAPAALPVHDDIACIDEILEDQEYQRKVLEERPPLDISFVFDASLGAPDDVVAHVFKFLTHREHNWLLQINKATRKGLHSRPRVWQQLCSASCPKSLPRRPRKPWHELYFHKLHMERALQTKKWDDLMLRISGILANKGDQLKMVQTIIAKAEIDHGFFVDYVSAVVCERNCILNLAVIHNRQKIVRWLVDEKEADIESYDRGQFTPLLNAAWAGNAPMVRYLLQRGADRTKVGKGHLSRALPHPDFEGRTAEEWARKRGHEEVAKLLHYGV